MMIDTILIAFVLVAWRWSPLLVVPMIGTFLLVDLAYFSANAIKIPQGGWFRWDRTRFICGSHHLAARRKLLFDEIARRSIPIRTIVDNLGEVNRAHGTAVFMVGADEGAPAALLHNLKHNQVLHERNVLLSVIVEDKPYVTKENRLLVDDLGKNFYRVRFSTGLCKPPMCPRHWNYVHRWGCHST